MIILVYVAAAWAVFWFGVFLLAWIAGEWCNPNCIWVLLGIPLGILGLLAFGLLLAEKINAIREE